MTASQGQTLANQKSVWRQQQGFLSPLLLFVREAFPHNFLAVIFTEPTLQLTGFPETQRVLGMKERGPG